MRTIFDKFQQVSSLDYYAKYYASKLDMNAFQYYWDNINHVQIPCTSNIRNWKEFVNYPDYRLSFNLTDIRRIKRYSCIEDYIREHKRLSFNLTIKGYSILYIIEFSNKTKPVQPDNINIIYQEEPNGQLYFNLN